MTSINGMGAMIFTPVTPINPGTTPSSSNTTIPLQLSGEAFALNISQQAGSGGTDSDSILFESYGQTASGGYATVSMSTGNNFQSAFEAMLANFQDASPAITNCANGTMDQFGQTAAGLGSMLGQLTASLQNSNSDGTAGVGEGMITSSDDSTSGTGASSGDNSSGGGVTSFLQEVLNSMEAGLNPTGGSGVNTAQT